MIVEIASDNGEGEDEDEDEDAASIYVPSDEELQPQKCIHSFDSWEHRSSQDWSAQKLTGGETWGFENTSSQWLTRVKYLS